MIREHIQCTTTSSNLTSTRWSFSMPNRKRNKCKKYVTFELFDEDVLDYDMYVAEMYDRENLVEMILNLNINDQERVYSSTINDIFQDNEEPGSFRCTSCLESFPELFHLTSHRCKNGDLLLDHDETRSPDASTVLTSTRKDFRDLLAALRGPLWTKQQE